MSSHSTQDHFETVTTEWPALSSYVKHEMSVVPPFLVEVVHELLVTPGFVATHAVMARYQRGVTQAAALWRPEDGDAAAFAALVREHFIADDATRDLTFERLEALTEQILGHFHEMVRAMRWHSDLDLGPMLALDRVMAGYAPAAHVSEDFFQNRVAFIALLNFPLSSLEQRLVEGPSWSRRRWAEERLVQRFAQRVPAHVEQNMARMINVADSYVANYNIWMHHVLDAEGQRHFPKGTRLISHWNLRDEIKACYSLESALPKQRLIQRVMEAIVTQTIPQVVIDNPGVDWNPYQALVVPAEDVEAGFQATDGAQCKLTAEPNTRYQHLLNSFHATQLEDPYHPTNPTLIARRFNDNREIPEARVEEMLEEVLGSPLLRQVGQEISSRLGRPLEPFDIWYSGFRHRGAHTEAQLDALVQERYPNLEAFAKGLPGLLAQLGFSSEEASFLAERISVDPARGAGHAMGAARRGDKAHLRTRVPRGGMDYKGFNIAMHELGHNVEQTYSLYNVDHYLLNGVPNTAFTEAVAFVFQNRDLEVLGLSSRSPQAEALMALNDYWATSEIAAVGLVDMHVWRWMYANPDCTVEGLKAEVLAIARRVWNRFYAPVMGIRDVPLLAIYSHMLDGLMYLPDYPLGHIIAHQLERHLAGHSQPAEELKRITSLGRLAPDVWMEQATGERVSAGPLLRSTERALGEVRRALA